MDEYTKSEEDFQSAADEMEALLNRFEVAGYDGGASMGGAMQALIFRMAMGATRRGHRIRFHGLLYEHSRLRSNRRKRNGALKDAPS